MLAAFQDVLLLLAAVAFIGAFARWIPVPAPVTLSLAGVGLAFTPAFKGMQLDPELFFAVFLPPLLFSDGWLIPIREMWRARRPILMLAIGLVGFTMVSVAAVAHALVPGLPWAMAFALGAVISPTDAVAVSAITSKLKVPYRLTAILDGESLLNDATGLVAFRFALLAVGAGSVSMKAIAGSFALLSLGGAVLGLALGWGVGKVRDGLRRFTKTDAHVETTLSLMTPFACYLLAEAVGVSTVLTVVAAGLYSGWRDPIKMDVETRQTAWSVWAIALYWLNGLAFLLLGLSAPTVYLAARQLYPLPDLLLFLGAISLVVVGARLLWMFPGAYLPRLIFPRIRATETAPSWRETFVSGWAGMRGSVTLAAALSIPLALPNGEAMPGRDIVIFLALGVVAVTLLTQATTLGPIIRILGIQEDRNRAQEEHLARVSAVRAGLEALRATAPAAGAPCGAWTEVVAEYEHRLAELDAEGESRSEAKARLRGARNFRLIALRAERRKLDLLWRASSINDDVYRPLQTLLDHEEAMLAASLRYD